MSSNIKNKSILSTILICFFEIGTVGPIYCGWVPESTDASSSNEPVVMGLPPKKWADYADSEDKSDDFSNMQTVSTAARSTDVGMSETKKGHLINYIISRFHKKDQYKMKPELEKIYSPKMADAIINFVDLNFRINRYDSFRSLSRSTLPYLNQLRELKQKNEKNEELVNLFSFILSSARQQNLNARSIYLKMTELILTEKIDVSEENFIKFVDLLDNKVFKEANIDIDIVKEVAALFKIKPDVPIQDIYYKLISNNFWFIIAPGCLEYLRSNKFITREQFIEIFENISLEEPRTRSRNDYKKTLELLTPIYNTLKAAEDPEKVNIISTEDKIKAQKTTKRSVKKEALKMMEEAQETQENDPIMEAETQQELKEEDEAQDGLLEEGPNISSIATSSTDPMPNKPSNTALSFESTVVKSETEAEFVKTAEEAEEAENPQSKLDLDTLKKRLKQITNDEQLIITNDEQLIVQFIEYLQTKQNANSEELYFDKTQEAVNEFESISEKLFAFNILSLLTDPEKCIPFIYLIHGNFIGFAKDTKEQEQKFVEAFQTLNDKFNKTKEIDKVLLNDILQLFTDEGKEDQEWILFYLDAFKDDQKIISFLSKLKPLMPDFESLIRNLIAEKIDEVPGIRAFKDKKFKGQKEFILKLSEILFDEEMAKEFDNLFNINYQDDRSSKNFLERKTTPTLERLFLRLQKSASDKNLCFFTFICAGILDKNLNNNSFVRNLLKLIIKGDLPISKDNFKEFVKEFSSTFNKKFDGWDYLDFVTPELAEKVASLFKIEEGKEQDICYKLISNNFKMILAREGRLIKDLARYGLITIEQIKEIIKIFEKPSEKRKNENLEHLEQIKKEVSDSLKDFYAYYNETGFFPSLAREEHMDLARKGISKEEKANLEKEEKEEMKRNQKHFRVLRYKEKLKQRT